MNFPLQLQKIEFHNGVVELFVPEATAVKEAYQKEKIAFPFWSQVWPAAKALTQFLLTNSFYTENKSVLEIGAGLGLPSLVAARNATAVLCTDSSTEAVQVVAQSATYCALTNFTTAVLDWHHLPQDLVADVLLLSDINYEPDAFPALRKMLDHFLEKGTTVLLSTPQRLMAKAFVLALLPHCIKQEELLVKDGNENVIVTVMVLRTENKARVDFTSPS